MAVASRSLRSRIASAAGNAGVARASTVIVKVIGKGIRSIHDVRRVVRYVARLEGWDREPYPPGGYVPQESREAAQEKAADPLPRVHDHAGMLLEREEILAALAEWEMLADSKNLSAKARGLEANGGSARSLPVDQKLRNVQAYHIIMSVPVKKRSDIVALEQAVSAVVLEQFAEAGHPALWALHVEHGAEVHAHVVVGSKPLDGGPRLRFDKAGVKLDDMRHNLAEEALALGLDVQATRRADRPEYLEQLVSGEALPKPDSSWIATRKTGISRLGAEAPEWLLRHGPEYIERRRRKAGRRLSGEKAYPAPIAAEAATAQDLSQDGESVGLIGKLLRRGRGEGEKGKREATPVSPLEAALRELAVFQSEDGRDRTTAALRRYRELRESTPALARWYMLNHPMLFDDVTASQLKLRDKDTRSRLLALLEADAKEVAPSGGAPASKPGSPVPVLYDRRALLPPESETELRRIVETVQAFISLERLARRAERAWPDEAEAADMIRIVRERAADLLQVPVRPSGEPRDIRKDQVQRPGPQGRGKGDGRGGGGRER